MERSKTSVDVHKKKEERSKEKAQTRDWKNINRTKKRMTIWFSDEVHDWLKKNVSNISFLIDQLVKSFRDQVEPAFILVSRIEPETKMRRPGFEPGAGARQAPVLDQATPSALLVLRIFCLICV